MTDYRQAAVETAALLRRRANRPTMRDMYDGTVQTMLEAADLLDRVAADREQLDKIRTWATTGSMDERCPDDVQAGFNQAKAEVRAILGPPAGDSHE